MNLMLKYKSHILLAIIIIAVVYNTIVGFIYSDDHLIFYREVELPMTNATVYYSWGIYAFNGLLFYAMIMFVVFLSRCEKLIVELRKVFKSERMVSFIHGAIIILVAVGPIYLFTFVNLTYNSYTGSTLVEYSSGGTWIPIFIIVFILMVTIPFLSNMNVRLQKANFIIHLLIMTLYMTNDSYTFTGLLLFLFSLIVSAFVLMYQLLDKKSYEDVNVTS